jgi:hypothetical protein
MRSIAAIAVAIGLLATTGVALAGIQGGRYEGTTAQGEDVSFKVTPRDKVKRIGYRVEGSCQNGGSYSFINRPDSNAVDINNRGRFHETVQGTSDSVATIRGRIKDNGNANGKVEAHRPASPPFGRCSTPEVRWHAER